MDQVLVPPIVQIGLSHANMKVQPVGHNVRLLTFVKINSASFLCEARPIGRAMIVANIKIKFMAFVRMRRTRQLISYISQKRLRPLDSGEFLCLDDLPRRRSAASP
jgi:hypothetical protein